METLLVKWVWVRWRVRYTEQRYVTYSLEEINCVQSSVWKGRVEDHRKWLSWCKSMLHVSSRWLNSVKFLSFPLNLLHQHDENSFSYTKCCYHSVEVIKPDKENSFLRASLLMRGREFVFSNPSLLKLSKSFYFVWMRELVQEMGK